MSFSFHQSITRRSIPLIIKIGLSLVIAVAIFPTINNSQLTLPDNLINFILLIFKELAIGFLIGYVATLAFGAFVMAGELISSEMGLSMAELVDPLFGDQYKSNFTITSNSSINLVFCNKRSSLADKCTGSQLQNCACNRIY